jgi:hypothetical protein
MSSGDGTLRSLESLIILAQAKDEKAWTILVGSYSDLPLSSRNAAKA